MFYICLSACYLGVKRPDNLIDEMLRSKRSFDYSVKDSNCSVLHRHVDNLTIYFEYATFKLFFLTIPTDVLKRLTSQNFDVSTGVLLVWTHSKGLVHLPFTEWHLWELEARYCLFEMLVNCCGSPVQWISWCSVDSSRSRRWSTEQSGTLSRSLAGLYETVLRTRRVRGSNMRVNLFLCLDNAF